MSIYIEYVLIDNLVINWFILLCVKHTLKLKAKWYRIMLSALLGTIVAVILPILNIDFYFTLPIKLILGIMMVIILSGYQSFKEFVFAFILLLGYTFLLGGACIATLLMFGTSLDALAAGGYDIAVPLGIIFLIVSIYVYIIISLAKYLGRRRVVRSFIRQVELVIGKTSLKLSAFLDSGNKLIDKASGMPVVILSLSCLEKHFSKDQLEALMLGNTDKRGDFKSVHTTPYSSVGGQVQKMVVFEADKLVINGDDGEYITNRFMVGVTFSKFKDAVNYQMLLNPYVM